MGRTYQALRKAESEKTIPIVPPRGGGGERTASWEPGVEAQLEYERIRVWITNPDSRGARVQTIMLVGCHGGGGTTTTAALVATTLAEGKRFRVLVVDANFRTPGLDRIFQTRGRGGLSDLLRGNWSYAEDAQIRRTARENLFVVPTGPVPEYPAEVVERVAAHEFMSQVKSKFDFILFDAPPILGFPDAYILAPHVDGIILVVEADRTSVDAAQKGKRELERTGGHILGVVLNRERDYLPRLLRRYLGAAA